MANKAPKLQGDQQPVQNSVNYRVPVPTSGKSKPYGSGTPKNGTKTTKGKRVSGYKSGGSYPTPGDNPFGKGK